MTAIQVLIKLVELHRQRCEKHFDDMEYEELAAFQKEEVEAFAAAYKLIQEHKAACREANRDRATKPKFGDQTACRFCRLDIEYHGKKTGWIDRGGNKRCPEEDIRIPRKHQPVSDRR